VGDPLQVRRDAFGVLNLLHDEREIHGMQRLL
jgi:hypothetical protein